MAGRRLLDAALVFNATRGVARQHLQLRAKQLDVWSKSSSLAKALKAQTDRVTLTAQAANALLRRTQEESPQSMYSTQAQQTTTEERVPRDGSVDHASKLDVVHEGLKQDHHYERALENTTTDTPPDGELSVEQEMPGRYSTPDGSLLPPSTPVDTAACPSQRSGSQEQRPGGVTPTETLVQGDRNGALRPETSGDSTILEKGGRVDTTRIPEHEVVAEQENIPEGVNTDVFYSPRVAKLLGGATKKSMQKAELEVSGAENVTGAKPASAEKMGQDTFNVRDTGTKQTSEPEAQTTENGQLKQEKANDIDTRELGADIANDLHAMSPAEALVRVLSSVWTIG